MKKIILTMLLLIMLPCMAVEEKIKFDKEVYNFSGQNNGEYSYFLKGENETKWDTKITIANFPDLTNKTEAAGDFAYLIQSENPGASVLLYPDAATLAYLKSSKDFYEYNTAVYRETSKGLNRFMFSKRFYVSDEGGLENAREAAIKFAEQNNKKYMEMVNKAKI